MIVKKLIKYKLTKFFIISFIIEFLIVIILVIKNNFYFISGEYKKVYLDEIEQLKEENKRLMYIYKEKRLELNQILNKYNLIINYYINPNYLSNFFNNFCNKLVNFNYIRSCNWLGIKNPNKKDSILYKKISFQFDNIVDLIKFDLLFENIFNIKNKKIDYNSYKIDYIIYFNAKGIKNVKFK